MTYMVRQMGGSRVFEYMLNCDSAGLIKVLPLEDG